MSIPPTIDKARFLPGPWQDEPDFEEWDDEPTGYRCRILRQSMGHLCGYVRVPEGHPWHGVEYGACTGASWCDSDDLFCSCRPDVAINVHGGLTFSGEMAEDPSGWWLGFDCAHFRDLSPLMAAEEPYFASGFYRDIHYVRDETLILARQLARVAEGMPAEAEVSQ